MKQPSKEMYSLIVRACKAQHPDCKTDIEALEAEISYNEYMKNMKQNANIKYTAEIEMIAILKKVISEIKTEQLEPITN